MEQNFNRFESLLRCRTPQDLAAVRANSCATIWKASFSAPAGSRKHRCRWPTKRQSGRLNRESAPRRPKLHSARKRGLDSRSRFRGRLPRSGKRVCQSCDRDQALRICAPACRHAGDLGDCKLPHCRTIPSARFASRLFKRPRSPFPKRNIPNSHRPGLRCAVWTNHAASVSVYPAHLRRRRLPRPESHESRCANRRLDDRHLSSAATRRLPYAAAPVDRI